MLLITKTSYKTSHRWPWGTCSEACCCAREGCVRALQVLAITERGTAEEILDLAFRLYDVDGNGTIEMRELAEILRVSSNYVICRPTRPGHPCVSLGATSTVATVTAPERNAEFGVTVSMYVINRTVCYTVYDS